MRVQTPWRQRLRLAVGWLTLFMIGTDLFVVSPLLPSIAHRFAILPSKAGLMVSTFSLLYAMGAPWFGAISDRIGKRAIIVTGLLGFMVANVLTSIAPSFVFLAASRGLAGLCAAAVTPSIYAVTGDVAPVQRRGRWLAIVGSGLLMALWLGAPIGTLAAHITHWSVVFLGLAVGSGVLTALNLRVWPSEKRPPALSVLHTGSRMGRGMLSDVGVTLFWGAAVYGLYTYLATGLRLYDHFSTDKVAVAVIVYGVGAMTGGLFGGPLSDRWGADRVSTGSLVSLAIGLALIGVFFQAGVWFLPFFVVFSFAGYVFFPAFQSRLAETFVQNRAKAMAWNNTALYIGITLGSLMGGQVITRSFETLSFLCAIMALIGALLSFIRAKRRAMAKASALT